MQENDSIRLKHIFDAANEALSFSLGKKVDDLNKDHMLALALVRLLEIIGEAARGFLTTFEMQILKFHGGKWLACATGSFMDILI